MPFTKEQSKEEISKLIEKYERIQTEGKIKRYNEETTKKDFILPLFEALGWDVYNKKADEVTAEEKASKGRVDYAFRINGIAKLFVEAKALKVDLDQPKWAQQAINYAWYKSVVWAILTDFEGIKVFNAEVKSTYPLQSMLFSLSYRQYLERFDQLWLLSRESLDQGLLDKEAEKWGKKLRKVPVDKQLLDDFTRWRELLSKDILKLNPDKHLTEEDLDESVQRILDRLIFIRSCEDRELEPKVLISDLREWVDKGRGALVKKVRERFRYFDDRYDSELFREHLCDDLEINNEVLKDIIYGLHKTKDMLIPYDFSAIDADVLGNIYEQYLGHLLKKTPKRAKLEAKKAHRKEHGIYYTPTYVVDYIVKNTLGELLKDKKVDAENIKILDPACGSGSFLIKSFDVLNEYWSKKNKYDQTELDTETGAMKPFTRKVKILKNNIFGVDLDPRAVEIARLNLLLKIAEKKQRLPLLQESIKCGNSLIDDSDVAGDKAFKWEEEFKEIVEMGGFDVVIGNPPYVTIGGKEDANISEEVKKYYSKNYESYEYKANYFVLFVERSISLLKDGGCLSFIVPRTLLDNTHMKNLRKIILDNSKIKILIELKYHVFEDAETGGNLIFVIEKCSKDLERNNNTVSCLLVLDIDNNLSELKYNKIKQSYFSKSGIFQFYVFDVSTINLIERIKKETKKLGEICLVSNGVNTGNAAKILLSNKKETVLYRKILEGKNINRYSIRWNGLWINYDPSLKSRIDLRQLDTRQKKIDFSLRNEDLFNSEKIILRQTADRLIGTFDNENYITRHSTHLIRMKDCRTSIKYILGLFNSKLLTYYYRTIIPEKGKAFAEVKVVNVEKLPIRTIPESQQQPIIQLVNEMLSLNKRLNEIGDKKIDERWNIEEKIRKTDAEIDQMVYKLYGLTEEEIRIIEETST